MWSDRLAWSGETPLTYPGLNPVAALRVDDGDLTHDTWPDAVDPSHTWALTFATGLGYTVTPGTWGNQLALNSSNPATQQGRLSLPNFAGLWPSSGKVLISLWVRQNYTMAFNPLMSTRGGASPVVYLSTYNNGQIRHQVHGPSGVVLDADESTPWIGHTGWQWIGQLVDLDAKTSQLAVVQASTGRKWLSPVRAASGAIRAGSTADLDVFALQTAGYWTGGALDEVLVAQPGAGFNFAAYVERIRLGTWAHGADTAATGKLTVTDAAVTATVAHTLLTGAEAVSWTQPPVPSVVGTPYWSTDDGATWSTGALPTVFTGLLRWEIPLAAGESFTGVTLLPPLPTLAPIADQVGLQRDTITVPLVGTWTGGPTWSVVAAGVAATVVGSNLILDCGWASGPVPVTVTVRDGLGRPASRTFTLTVNPAPWTPDLPPGYPRAPIILRGDDGNDEAIIDALSVVVTEEVNGEHTVEFSVPAKHRKAGMVLPERAVEIAGDRYRIRRITTARQAGTPVLKVFCEARFYDLAYAGQLPSKDYLQTPAGIAMEDAVNGTGWTVGAVTVTTRRTYSTEETNPLAMLRTIADQHGGDLLFDNVARTVSLVVQSGHDTGVSFFYGHSLTESKRVVDTTSLVTRIHARNADGVSIESVNSGKSYVEDFTWTTEVREATYDFAAGTSPWTMLAMTKATLANRAKPAASYEFTVADLSFRTGQAIDRFDVGDMITVVDDELGIRESQRIIRVEHDVARPWASKITLSGKLRESGGASAAERGALSSGSQISTFDLVPFNLLRNGRFDNGLAHWAASGVSLVAGHGTGDRAIRFEGTGVRWVEQTVHPDKRDVYAISLDATAVGGGAIPPLTVVAVVEYEDGTTDTIPVELA